MYIYLFITLINSPSTIHPLTSNPTQTFSSIPVHLVHNVTSLQATSSFITSYYLISDDSLHFCGSEVFNKIWTPPITTMDTSTLLTHPLTLYTLKFPAENMLAHSSLSLLLHLMTQSFHLHTPLHPIHFPVKHLWEIFVIIRYRRKWEDNIEITLSEMDSTGWW
jgi:F0F1-type ATP synthase membrane subunit a